MNKIISFLFLFLLISSAFADNVPVKPAGEGTSKSPFLFSQIENFVWLSEQCGKISPNQIIYCKQIEDIDCSETKDWQSNYYDESNLSNSNYWYRGFPYIYTAVGDWYNDRQVPAWILEYDGQNYSIISPFVSGVSQDNNICAGQGLFAQGVFRLKNINLVDVSLKNGGGHIGLLAGRLHGGSSIINCHANGMVTDLEGEKSVGMIGEALLFSGENINISNSSSDISIYQSSKGNSSVGGVIGLVANYEGEIAINKVSANSKIFDAKEKAGGFIGCVVSYGNNISVMQDCFSIVHIEKAKTASASGFGGFIGCAYNLTDESQMNLSVLNCYSSGNISFKSSVLNRSFIYIPNSENTTLNITNCYYNSTTFDYDDSFAVGRTDEEMKQAATFEGWDFEKTWHIDEGESYPCLIFNDPEEGGEEEEEYAEVNVKYKGTGTITQVNGVITLDGGSEKDGLIISALPNSECKVKKLLIPHSVKKLRVDGDLCGLYIDGKLGTLLINGGNLGETNKNFAVIFNGDKTKVQVKAAKNKKTNELVGGDVTGNILCGTVDEEGNILTLGKIKKITSLGGNFENGKLVAESVDSYQAKAKKDKGGAITNFTIETK